MKTKTHLAGGSVNYCYHSFLLLFSFLFVLCVSITHAQVNAYARITAVSGTTLTLSNANTTYHSFTAGDQVVVMQMQDNVIGTTTNTSGFGSLSAISNAGLYEVATISSVGFTAGVPTSVVLTTALKRAYTTGSNSRVQLISFRNYGTNYTVSAAITPLAWDGNIGGVVAIQVSGTLTLSKSITADGLGFRGGAVSANYESSCEPAVYTSSSTNYANKGEGIYLATDANYAGGRGKIINGGGGGSDDNGGGGGGGNFTFGGDGGPGWTCTAATASGGLGGLALSAYSIGSRIFMGGGGGGGQQNNSLGTAGGNGGGIILIKATTLATSCSGTITLSANGVAAAASGNDGAGGGGAAGTIILQVGGYSVPSGCPLSIRSNGGNGGNVGNTDAHGGGGGGGQGAIYSSASLTSANVSAGTAAGTGGLNSSAAGATSAGSGGGPANAGITGTMLTSLPVTLTAFTAIKKGRKVLLGWSTMGEYQNQLFNIQRSTNGIDFITVATVTGTNTGISGRSYNYTDPNDPAVKLFYRIEMIDLTGNKDYSAVAVVTAGDDRNGPLAIYPNPAHGAFFIQVNGSSDKYFVQIADLAGKPVYYNSYGPVNNLLTVAPGNALTPGIYIVKLADNKNVLQFGKVVIR